MSDPAPERPASDAAPEKKGVSPVVWIGLAAVVVAGGIYAYAVMVPPEMPKDGLIEESDGEAAFDEGYEEAAPMTATPAEPNADETDAEETADGETAADRDGGGDAGAEGADDAETGEGAAGSGDAGDPEPVATGG
ncbi:hypothetical protein [Alienimonas sp. DA493]|uniref:hypothetical protein n=1 Tax=Alienimonas sp. DA493 TaxID=3373605 RepID=UPI003754F2FF